MQKTGIYQIQSITIPDRVYIGSATSIQNRWWIHLCKLRHNKHHSRKLQNHYNKYGESDLCFSILYECCKQYLIVKEQEYINLFNPFFNIRKVADNNTGIKYSKESCLKMSKSKTGILHTTEHKNKISRSLIGRKYSEETINKMSSAQKGRILSEDHKLRISKANRGRIVTYETKQKQREKALGRLHSESSKLKMRKPKPEGFSQKIKESWIIRKQKLTNT
jgi:group I intron endonuclease